MPNPADSGPSELVWSLSLERCHPSPRVAGSGLGDRAALHVLSGPSLPKCPPMSPARFTGAVKPDLHHHKQRIYMIKPLLKEDFRCFLKEQCAMKGRISLEEDPGRVSGVWLRWPGWEPVPAVTSTQWAFGRDRGRTLTAGVRCTTGSTKPGPPRQQSMRNCLGMRWNDYQDAQD